MGRGSMRQRGTDTWELRVDLRTDVETGRQRWATTTVHGSRRHAQAQLAEFVEEAGHTRLRAGGRDGRPLAPGTVHRVHVVLHRALAQGCAWDGCG